MEKIRTFVAVELSAAVIDRAADLIDRLRASGARVKWVEPHNMHLTLKFLGDVPEGEIPGLCRAVAETAGEFARFDVSLVGAGAFPDTRRPRTVWIGIDKGLHELSRLYEALEKALKKIGFPKESRRFHPHLTIGRVREGGPAARQLGQLIEEHRDFDAAGATIDKMVVFASFLDKSGPTYRAMGTASLSG
jgi:2'-5' RNA ligase